MKSKKRVLSVVVILAMLLSMSAVLSGCGGEDKDAGATDAKESEKKKVILATTTSTKDSGLLDEIMPAFEKESGYQVDVVSVGSGEAMAMGEAGEADVLLVHSPADEKKFVDGGHADKDGRLDVMYNDFVLLGSKKDPASIEKRAKEDAVKAFQEINKKKATFISRADESGTHKKELSIWEEAKEKTKGDWYVEAAAGMGDVITMADEEEGYTLSDRATWLNMSKDTDLKIVCEKDPSGVLNNQYGVICVNPEKNDNMNAEGAKAFQKWIVSEETQKTIGAFGSDQYDEALFVPNAK